MKVDMSPEAISGRLNSMGELWELSVKLMGSKVAGGKSTGTHSAFAIQDSIRKVLIEDWDPLGISDVSECGEEYDSYIALIYRILVGSRAGDDLVEALCKIERDEMGVRPANSEVLLAVAKRLLELKVTLN
jgi:hypothetical protein